jgi:electron transport complex protein RnfC
MEKTVTVGQDGAMSVVVRVPLGTPFSRLLEHAGLKAEDGDRLFTGGPLTGVAQFDAEAPVTKGTDGLFLQKGKGVPCYEDVACIGCGQCVKVCPMKIPVNMMTRNCEFGRVQEAIDYDLDSCIECGLCAYVCTSRRPLLQYIQFAKKEQQKAELARQSA